MSELIAGTGKTKGIFGVRKCGECEQDLDERDIELSDELGIDRCSDCSEYCEYCGDNPVAAHRDRCKECQEKEANALAPEMYVQAYDLGESYTVSADKSDMEEDMTYGVYRLVRRVKRVVKRTVEEEEVEV